jgi:hypothetical protein
MKLSSGVNIFPKFFHETEAFLASGVQQPSYNLSKFWLNILLVKLNDEFFVNRRAPASFCSRTNFGEIYNTYKTNIFNLDNSSYLLEILLFIN